MKIESITTRNFMRLKNVTVDTSGNAVHLFCGPNECGKSSLKEAVRVALIGTSPRVKHKKDHNQLVTDGQRRGRVTLKYRNDVGAEVLEMFRGVDSEGAVSPKDFRFDDFSVACLNFALQIQSFAEAKEEDRRKVLAELFEIRMSADAVDKMLGDKFGVPESFRKHVKPLLRAGFEAAHKDVVQKKANARASWVANTGEAWGDEKVKTWQPPEDSSLEVVPPEKITASTQALEVLDSNLSEKLKAQGALQARGDARARLMVEMDECGQLKSGRAKLRASRSGAVIDIQEVESAIEDVKGRLATIDASKQVLSCPNCDHKVRLQGTELVPANIDDLDIGAGDSTLEPELREELRKAQADLSTKQRGLADLDAKIAKAYEAEKRIAAIGVELAKLDEEVDLDALSAEIVELRKKRADAAVAHSKLLAAQDKTSERETKLANIKKALEDYNEWSKIVDALAPDCIPATLLLEAIAPINRRLEESAAIAGWPRVQLNASMEIVRDSETEKRPYALLSESAQWRAAALVADAISSISGMRILVLDRMDVLTAGEDRKQCLRWVQKLGESDYHTILVFATMATKPPADAVFGAQVHWMPDVVANQSTDK